MRNRSRLFDGKYRNIPEPVVENSTYFKLQKPVVALESPEARTGDPGWRSDFK